MACKIEVYVDCDEDLAYDLVNIIDREVQNFIQDNGIEGEYYVNMEEEEDDE